MKIRIFYFINKFSHEKINFHINYLVRVELDKENVIVKKIIKN